MQKLIFYIVFVCFSVTAFETIPNESISIPMRDGTLLPADIYYRSDFTPKSCPCILVRSAAGKTSIPALSALPLVAEGYVVVIQDTRSKIDPEGKTMPCIDDGFGCRQDSFDTIEWLHKSPYSNGSIGTYGPSALGIVQLMMAPTQPIGLKAQYIQFACGSVYDHAAYPGGQFHKHQIESWFHYYANHPSVIDKVKKEKVYSHFWSQMNANSRAQKVKTPAVFLAGWYDTFLQGTLEAFQKRQKEGAEGAKGKQKLIIGPWAHFWPLDRNLGDYPVPKEGYAPPNDITPSKWFDHYLKGEENGINNVAAVQYFVMGPVDDSSIGHIWKTSEHWPPPYTPTSLYLTEDNSLRNQIPSQNALLSYVYNPENPCPTLGGRNLFIESGPKDQRPNESRDDTVIFTSEPFTSNTEITGPLKAEIYFETDCEDTDLMIRLSDVYPDGRSLLITDGAYRIGYRRTDNIANKIHRIFVDLASTSLMLAKGHSLRVAITSSNYPRYEKNLNVKNENVPPKIAHNKIHIGPNTASRLIIPVN